MARLKEPPEKYGTYDNICVYPMYGEAFLRTASSLVGNGERVKTEAAFKNTMLSAGRLSVGSRLGAAVYAMLPPSRQKFSFYRKLTGQAIRLLKEGKTEGEVVVELMITIRLPKRKPRKKAVVRRMQSAAPIVFIAPAAPRVSASNKRRAHSPAHNRFHKHASPAAKRFPRRLPLSGASAAAIPSWHKTPG